MKNPRRKIFGAALAARKKRLTKLKRSRVAKMRRNSAFTYLPNPSRAKARKRRPTMARKVRRKRKNPARKYRGAWATRRKNYAARRRAALKGARTRGRKGRPRYSPSRGFAMSLRRSKALARKRRGGRKAAPRKKRKATSRGRAVQRRAPQRPVQRRAPKRRVSRRKGSGHKGWKTREAYYRVAKQLPMGPLPRYWHREYAKRAGTIKPNPRRKRRRNPMWNPSRKRARRRNPVRRFSLRRNAGDIVGGIKSVAMQALPVVGGMIVGRLVVSQVSKRVPQIAKLGTHANPVLHLLMVVAGQFATKKVGFLAKHRDGIMVGLGVNLVQSVISTYAPASVKGAIGMGAADEGVYDEALGALYAEQGALYAESGDYVETADYVETGDMSQSDYVETGLEQEMGDDELEEELGDEESLSGSNSMLAPVGRRQALIPIQNKSYVKAVPSWSPSREKGLYKGIFSL